MESLKRLALAALTMGAVACGDDDDTVTRNLDASVDSSVDGGRSDAGDASGFACYSWKEPTATQCGGSHCLETPAQLASETPSNAVCGSQAEVAGLCSLDTINKVTDCIFASVAQPAGDMRKAATKACAMPMLPDYSGDCLDCFVDSAECAAVNCISVCVPSSKTAACDQCRVEKGCIPNFYTCAGIKNPIPGF